MFKFPLLAGAIALCAASATAATLRLDFDTAQGVATQPGDIAGGAFAGFGVTLGLDPRRASSTLALFDSDCGPDFGVRCTGGDDDLASGPSFGTAPQGRVLIINEGTDANPDDDARGGWFRFAFDGPVRLDSVELLDLDERAVAKRLSFRATFADGLMRDLDPLSVALLSTATGDNSLRRFGFEADGVTGFDVRYDGVSGAIGAVTFAPAVIPLPATATLLGGGLVALALAARRRRR